MFSHYNILSWHCINCYISLVMFLMTNLDRQLIQCVFYLNFEDHLNWVFLCKKISIAIQFINWTMKCCRWRKKGETILILGSISNLEFSWIFVWIVMLLFSVFLHIWLLRHNGTCYFSLLLCFMWLIHFHWNSFE